MASSEQQNLSEFIKSIHKNLREEVLILGTQQAWDNHCNNVQNLEKYSKAMHELAVKHWDKNVKNSGKVVSRVSWVYEACNEYYGSIEKFRNKELQIVERFKIAEPRGFKEVFTPKYRLLDVGSCYNPFKQFEIFDVVALDIAPANSDVFKADFLNLKIADQHSQTENTITELQEASFDIIVFSLLLEYLPTPDMRLKACKNAYDLLKSEGILVIITPDSNHVGSNAKIIKSWQYVLAKYGFMRLKYEKLPHIHCMVFRKALHEIVAHRWAELHQNEGLFQKIYIPQDFSRRIDQVQENKTPLVNNKWSDETFLNSFECNLNE